MSLKIHEAVKPGRSARPPQRAAEMAAAFAPSEPLNIILRHNKTGRDMQTVAATVVTHAAGILMARTSDNQIYRIDLTELSSADSGRDESGLQYAVFWTDEVVTAGKKDRAPREDRLKKLTSTADMKMAQKLFNSKCSSDNMADFHSFMRKLDALLVEFDDGDGEEDAEPEPEVEDTEVELDPDIKSAVAKVTARFAG